MNHNLWESILAFDIDSPAGEYTFSLRLAHENVWTKSFTAQAILEYKKFMYLAATSTVMVSPSETVDKVWHQHLIFTQSYHNFCALLGKHIQHIPSTHSKEDYQKFKQAKEATKANYERHFGTQPKGIWHNNEMLDSLSLERSSIGLLTFLIGGLLGFILLTLPAYLLLKPFYITINNPYFIFGLVALVVFVFITLELYNRNALKRIISRADSNSFIHELDAFELVYLKTQQVKQVINGNVNSMIRNKTVGVNSNHTIKLLSTKPSECRERQQVISSLGESNTKTYGVLMAELIQKPVFSNTAKSMDAIKQHFKRSKQFGKVFYTNFTVLALLLLLPVTRIVTGIERGKSVLAISIVTVTLAAISLYYLQRLVGMVCTITLPKLYKKKVLSSDLLKNTWQWNYFLMGKESFVGAFLPLFWQIERNNNTNNGNSCGSGCGSSCGGGCGGCGGCGS